MEQEFSAKCAITSHSKTVPRALQVALQDRWQETEKCKNSTFKSGLACCELFTLSCEEAKLELITFILEMCNTYLDIVLAWQRYKKPVF